MHSDTSRLKARRSKGKQVESVTCASCSSEYHISCLINAYKEYRMGCSKSQQNFSQATAAKRSKNGPSVAQSTASVAASTQVSKEVPENVSEICDQSLEDEALQFLKEKAGIQLGAPSQKWKCLSCLLTTIYDLFCRAGPEGDDSFYREVELTKFEGVSLPEQSWQPTHSD